MTSVFDLPGCYPGLPCVPPTTGRSDEVYLSPQSDSVESPEFEVLAAAAVVTAFDLKPGQRVRVEAVSGYRDSTLYAPVVHHGQPLRLAADNTQLAVVWPGRYRLVAEGAAPGIDMPTVIVLRRNAAIPAFA